MAGAVIRPLGIDVTVDKDDLIKMSTDQFHQACFHQWGKVLDATAINLGHHLFRKLKPCMHCARAKIQQKKTAKETVDDRAFGSRIAFDLIWCADRTAMGNELVLVMIDYETDKGWLRSLKRKEDVPEAGLKFMDELV